MKNKGLIISGIAGGIILILFAFLIIKGIENYNNLIQLDNAVSKQWSELCMKLEKRTDLAPSLTDAVKAYVGFDSSSIIKLNDAYNNVTNVLDKSDLPDDSFTFHKYEDAQMELANSISDVLIQLENYPELKANENILQLRAQIVRNENQLNDELKKFNATVDSYNQSIERFPASIIALILRFKEKNYFQTL